VSELADSAVAHAVDAQGVYQGLQPWPLADGLRQVTGSPPTPAHRYVEGLWLLPLSLAEVKASALQAIDNRAETQRNRYLTPGGGQAMTYLIKFQQAEAWQLAGMQGPPPAMVQAEALATGTSAAESCMRILEEAQQFNVLGAAIERARRSQKIAVNAATTEQQIQTAQAAFFLAMDQLP
jgi:hypothetical protein